MSFLWFIIVGAVAGWLAGKFIQGSGFGFLMNLFIGIAGGVLGGWLFSLLGIAAGGILGSIITAFVGAVLLLWIVNKAKA